MPDLQVPNSPEDPKKPQNSKKRQALLYVLLLAAIFAFISGPYLPASMEQQEPKQLATNQFVTAVQEDRVKDVTFSSSSGDLKGSYWPKGTKSKTPETAKPFVSSYPPNGEIDALMAKHPNTVFKVNNHDTDYFNLFVTEIIPIILLGGLMFWVARRMMQQTGRTMDFGKASAEVGQESRPKVKFSDVAGIDEAVEELKEVRDFLSEPERFQKMGAKIPHGVLLVGPPGTGKTLLAKAVAGEAGVPFFSLSGSDFVEMFVGVGASRVRDLFKQAKKASPAIIFIDEIDAVGRQRGAGVGGGHDEREQTLNQLLVEMDGFEANDAVILIAATNRPDVLDPALLRPGRFDRQVTVERPDVVGREQILKVHGANKPLDETVKFNKLAKLTPGFTGADLANLMNESALLAARRHKEKIGMPEVEEAMERVIAGPERKSRVMTESERKTIAYHESGHALVGHLLENSDPVHKISIISRGQALGYTLQMPEEDRFLETRQGMLDEIATLLGGRCAEELFCSDITTGASNDLERATKIARDMVTRYGMSKELGTQVFGEAQHEVFLGRDYADHQDFSGQTAQRIDEEVARIMAEQHQRAQEILTQHKDRMDTMAQVLLVRETVEGDAVEALLDGKWDQYLQDHPEEAQRTQKALEGIPEKPAGSQSELDREAEEDLEVPGHKEDPDSL